MLTLVAPGIVSSENRSPKAWSSGSTPQLTITSRWIAKTSSESPWSSGRTQPSATLSRPSWLRRISMSSLESRAPRPDCSIYSSRSDETGSYPSSLAWARSSTRSAPTRRWLPSSWKSEIPIAPLTLLRGSSARSTGSMCCTSSATPWWSTRSTGPSSGTHSSDSICLIFWTPEGTWLVSRHDPSVEHTRTAPSSSPLSTRARTRTDSEENSAKLCLDHSFLYVAPELSDRIDQGASEPHPGGRPSGPHRLDRLHTAESPIFPLERPPAHPREWVLLQQQLSDSPPPASTQQPLGSLSNPVLWRISRFAVPFRCHL